MQIRPPALKVCGITRAADVHDALSLGVAYLGVNRHRPSPRYVPEENLAALLAVIPAGRRVFVDVSPGLPELHAAQAAGFDVFQIHFDPLQTDERRVKLWSDKVGARNLWLAPRLKDGAQCPPYLFKYAQGFLVDGYSPAAFGGTGKTANWSAVAALRSLHKEKTWVVAGGLGPDNLVEAARASQADILDLNSGVESAPGLKDFKKLHAAVERLRREIGLRD